jgi:AraC-like DNA-binding protein
MKPQLLKVSNEVVHSFNTRQDSLPNINNSWHYHPEIELIHFHKGSGTQFVGDSIKRFGPDDIVLVGSNLPHYWKYDENSAFGNENAQPYSTVIHFYHDFWSERFLNLPENKVIKTTLDDAKRGIQIIGSKQREIGKLMNDMVHAEGPRRIILLMEALMEISYCSKTKQLSSMGFRYNFDEPDKDRINLICNYSFANFKNKILLNEISVIANLSPNAFCRYFKSKTRKTYSQFINEIRIGNACKLLIHDKINVKQICYESGFNNFSSFHTVFKSITGKTPLGYKREFLLKRN